MTGRSPQTPADSAGNDWRTPTELADFRTTPDYAETVAYLERLVAAYPESLQIENFGRSGEGRDLKVVIVAKDGLFEPAKVHDSGRAVLLVQNAIHAGEMDGKDACLALARDLVRSGPGSDLLEHVVLVFIPVYNVDGHERRSAYNRINQRGPEVMGWRANGTNLNLNRDYLKADAPETRAFLRLFHRWLPDFFIDNHVTDGADFQYDVTFQLDATPDVHPETARWIRESVKPELVRRVEAAGHPTFPDQIFLNDDTDPEKGLAFNDNPPRFSTGQMILENRPGLLVELHMLKDYRTRVSADYEVMKAVLAVLNRDHVRLVELNRLADAAAVGLASSASRGARFPLILERTGETTLVPFRGIRFVREPSEVSGATAVRYTGEPWETSIPMDVGARAAVEVIPPAGYIVPAPWTTVIDVLEAHGVTFDRTRFPWTGTVERYRLSGMRWPSRPFEGRRPILRGGNVEREFGRFGSCALSTETATFPVGSVVVPLAQRLSKVVIHWLEPEAPDSALRWGFFDSIFEQKESGDAYVLEKLARDQLERNPALRAEFDRRLAHDPEFAASSAARLEFFYARSAWGSANRVGEYPVGRLLSLTGLPTG